MTLRLIQGAVLVALGLCAWHPGLPSALLALGAFAALTGERVLSTRQAQIEAINRVDEVLGDLRGQVGKMGDRLERVEGQLRSENRLQALGGRR